MKVEIHVDVGTHGATKELVKEIIGMIVGSGLMYILSRMPAQQALWLTVTPAKKNPIFINLWLTAPG